MTEIKNIITAVRFGHKFITLLRSHWWKQAIEKKFQSLERQIGVAAEKVKVLDVAYQESDEFHSLSLKIVLAAANDHREVKHAMLAAALVSSTSKCVEWSYEKKTLLLDLITKLEPYHITILEKCPIPQTGQLHIHTWEQMRSIQGLPEPQIDILVNAIQRLHNESLITYLGGGQMMRSDSNFLAYVTYLPSVLEKSKFCRTRLADDLLCFLMKEKSE